MKRKQELNDLKEKDAKSLYKELESSSKKLNEMQFKAAFRKLKNYQEIKATKKKIARIWTILAEKTSAEMEKEEIK